MNRAARGRAVSFDHVEAALELLGSESPRSVDMPGHSLERLGGRLVLRSSDAGARQRPRANFFDYPLSIPGEVLLPQAGCVLAAESSPAGYDPGALGLNVGAAVVRRDLCSGPLRVRNRRPGDRFRPFGLGGRTKKLQDYFVDRKVARQRRDVVPLVVDGRDRIVWVAGFDIDDTFRVTDSAQAVLILRLKLLGGPA
jgi:tRNA(Ile)-lysidine synthase